MSGTLRPKTWRHIPENLKFSGTMLCEHRACGYFNITFFYKNNNCFSFYFPKLSYMCRSQCPRGLRRGSAAARLLGLRVRILLGAWTSLSLVSVVCCQVEVSATGWSLVQRSLTECGVSECDREASIMRRPRPTRGCCDIEKIDCIITPCRI
jgi:hypothetical protein